MASQNPNNVEIDSSSEFQTDMLAPRMEKLRDIAAEAESDIETVYVEPETKDGEFQAKEISDEVDAEILEKVTAEAMKPKRSNEEGRITKRMKKSAGRKRQQKASRKANRGR